MKFPLTFLIIVARRLGSQWNRHRNRFRMRATMEVELRSFAKEKSNAFPLAFSRVKICQWNFHCNLIASILTQRVGVTDLLKESQRKCASINTNTIGNVTSHIIKI